jgi:hypothetical protein
MSSRASVLARSKDIMSLLPADTAFTGPDAGLDLRREGEAARAARLTTFESLSGDALTVLLRRRTRLLY